MTQAPEGIIERIKKCLKLGANGSGATEAEAETAIKMAKRLMAEHNVNMSDVEFKEEVKLGAQEAVDKSARQSKENWEIQMRHVCNHLFACASYIDYQVRKEDDKIVKRMKFVGVGMDAEIAAEAYTILLKVVRNMGSKAGYEGQEFRNYCLGVVDTLIQRAAEKAEGLKPKEEIKERGIMVIKDQLVKAHLKTLHLTKHRQNAGGFQPGAYDHGRQDGKKVNLTFSNQLK